MKYFILAMLAAGIVAGAYLIILKDENPATAYEDEKSMVYELRPGTTWQWQLSGDLNLEYKVDVYDLDLERTPAETITGLHDRGISVICYFSAGSWEDFRADADLFPESVLGNVLDGWPDEKWLDISNYMQFDEIMLARLDSAVAKDCDAVEPDNIDAYANDSGFDSSYEHQLAYNKWLADEAHKRGLAIALKNDLGQIPDLIEHYDFAINEVCYEHKECDALDAFVTADKAVLGVEYTLGIKDFCADANARGFSWLKMGLELSGSREACS